MRILSPIFALALLAVSGCESTTSPEALGTVESGKRPLRVGITPNAPPFAYKGNGGKISGVEADFAQSLGNRFGRSPQFVTMNFDKLLPSLEAGKIDIIMSGMTVTTMRESRVDFCKAYMISGQALLVRSADIGIYSYPQVIYVRETRIGVEKGTIGATLAERRCPNSRITTYNSPRQAAAALKAGRIDVFIGDAPTVWRLGVENESTGLSPIPKLLTKELLAWAVRRGDVVLRDSANQALDAMDKNGTIDSILRRYMPRYDLIRKL